MNWHWLRLLRGHHPPNGVTAPAMEALERARADLRAVEAREDKIDIFAERVRDVFQLRGR